MSDTLILRNAVLATGSTVIDLPAQGWVVLEQGICCRGDAEGYAAASTIDIVGMADASAFKAHFLLLP